jgi:diguanylate cyclase (GGDEF)-like protein
MRAEGTPSKPPSRVEVLLVEDNPGDADLVRETLSCSHHNGFVVTRVARLDEALCELKQRDFDVILLDLALPDRQGLQTLKRARAAASSVPIVVMTGLDDEGLALQAVQSGAQDYLVKGHVEPRILSRILRHAIERQQLLSELERAREREHLLATRDPLTGLPNRQFFFDHLSQAMAQAERRSSSLAVLFLDIDRFKNINDSLGHEMGDRVLQELAQRLLSCVRVGDAATRLGGDEFTITISDVSREQDVARVAEKILGVISKPCVIEGHELCVTSSVGIALFPSDGRDCTTLIQNADAAMYTAKEQGRSTFRFYRPAMNDRACERLLLENELRLALRRNELRVYYQPEVSVVSGEIIAAEALVRWDLPGRGILLPSDFMGLAEQTGLIVPISEWVLRTACQQNKAWRRDGYPPIRMAVNLSPRQLKVSHLERTVAEVLTECGLDASSLELEFPESGMALEAALDTERLLGLKRMGVRLAIDDFGTGYSSFGVLKSLAFDVLKIDQSFIQGITSDRQGAAIAAAMIRVADGLELDSIAEGVETDEQLEFLRSHKCGEMQGYLFSRPVPPEKFSAFWEKL